MAGRGAEGCRLFEGVRGGADLGCWGGENGGGGRGFLGWGFWWEKRWCGKRI